MNPQMIPELENVLFLPVILHGTQCFEGWSANITDVRPGSDSDLFLCNLLIMKVLPFSLSQLVGRVDCKADCLKSKCLKTNPAFGRNVSARGYLFRSGRRSSWGSVSTCSLWYREPSGSGCTKCSCHICCLEFDRCTFRNRAFPRYPHRPLVSFGKGWRVSQSWLSWGSSCDSRDIPVRQNFYPWND